LVGPIQIDASPGNDGRLQIAVASGAASASAGAASNVLMSNRPPVTVIPLNDSVGTTP
jgi:hypothetical protein